MQLESILANCVPIAGAEKSKKAYSSARCDYGVIMEEIRQKKRRRKIILFSILGAVVLLVIALIIGCSLSGDDTKEKEGEYKQVERRTIVNSVSGSGVVRASDSEDVTSQRFGTMVNAVYVKEGDTVTPGQVICQFDTKDLQEQLNGAQKSIADAKNNKAEQDDNFDRRVIEALNNKSNSINETNARLNQARLEYIEALNELDKANKNYEDYMAVPYHNAYDSDAVQLEMLIESRKSNVDVKKNNIQTLEETLNNLNNSDYSGVNDAKISFDEGADSSIRALEERVSDINRAIADCTVRSKVGGTITSLNVKEGERFTGGKVAVIEGTNALLVEAEVSEYDIADIAVGMKAMMKTDATRDQELSGVVTYVAPKASNEGAGEGIGALSGLIGMDMSSLASSGSTGNSSATYLIKIAFDEQNPRLRLGMNAKVSIITESVENAVSVPYESVVEESNGDKYIEIATNYNEASTSDGKIPYEKKKVKVTTGIRGSYYVEVRGDISVGDYVYVPAAEGADSLDEIMDMMGSSAGV